LDVVALDGTTLVILEVRSTSGNDTSVPAASVDYDKQRRLSRMALWFRRRHRFQSLDLRLDVLAISWPEGQQPVFEHHPNAFPIQECSVLDG
jgi:putative endonuclease